uniref:Zinc finger protein, putative n=1 Tax=Arundo donax TaxID=35708 RepID=A0A0A9D6P0_ARUDO
MSHVVAITITSRKYGIFVAKKRVTHSVPQAPHVDGKESTSSGAEYLHSAAATSSRFP